MNKATGWQRWLLGMAGLCAVLLLATLPAQAEERLVTVPREGYQQSGLVVTAAESGPRYRHGVALFAGHPGILRLREEGGVPQYELKGNFLIRSRQEWLDADTLVLLVDAPSDQWNTFSQYFRTTTRYGEDVAALLSAVGERYGVGQWTLVGTSEGSVSAFHAARMNPALATRLILSASVFSASRNGTGLSNADPATLKSRLLLVHHADDPCPYTRHADAVRFAERAGAPLLTVRGGGIWQGDVCQARTAHGFIGAERETVLAMRRWLQQGELPEGREVLLPPLAGR